MVHSDSSFNFWKAILLRERAGWRAIGVPFLLAASGMAIVALIHRLTGYYLSLTLLVTCTAISLCSGFFVSMLIAVGLSLYGDYFYLEPIGSVFDSPHAFEHAALLIALTSFVCFFAHSLRQAFRRLDRARIEIEGKQAAVLAKQKAEAETAALERVLSLVSHDLLNSLATINLQAQLLQRVGDDSQRQIALTKRIQESVQRADSLLKTLLDVTRVKSGKALPLNFEMADLCAAVGLAMHAYEENPRVRFVPLDRALEGKWSVDGLVRAVDNLVSNALKYGGAGTSVTVEIVEREGQALISVHNLGNELSEQELSRLFDKFYRAPSAEAQGVGGWGLGLVLVKAVAEAHQGTVKVDSAKGKGTTFTLSLPVRRAKFDQQTGPSFLRIPSGKEDAGREIRA